MNILVRLERQQDLARTEAGRKNEVAQAQQSTERIQS
jgi:hypothetical protein